MSTLANAVGGIQNTCYSQRTHSIVREHILQSENTFQLKDRILFNVHTCKRCWGHPKHMLQSENTFYSQRTHSLVREHILQSIFYAAGHQQWRVGVVILFYLGDQSAPAASCLDARIHGEQGACNSAGQVAPWCAGQCVCGAIYLYTYRYLYLYL